MPPSSWPVIQFTDHTCICIEEGVLHRKTAGRGPERKGTELRCVELTSSLLPGENEA